MACGQTPNLDAGADAVSHFPYMRNNTDFAALGVQVIQCVHGNIQGFCIQAAKTFINEKGFHLNAVRGQGGQSQCQGQGYQKGFSAGKRVYRPHLVSHVLVNYHQGQPVADPLQSVAAGQLFQVAVGITQQDVQCHLLGVITEFAPVCRPDQFIQPTPDTQGLLPSRYLLIQLGSAYSQLVVLLQGQADPGLIGQYRVAFSRLAAFALFKCFPFFRAGAGLFQAVPLRPGCLVQGFGCHIGIVDALECLAFGLKPVRAVLQQFTQAFRRQRCRCLGVMLEPLP